MDGISKLSSIFFHYARILKNLSKLKDMPPVHREVDYHEAITGS